MFRLLAKLRPAQPIEADDDDEAERTLDAHHVAVNVPAEGFKYVEFEVEEFIID